MTYCDGMTNTATTGTASRNVDLTIGTNVHMLMWRRGESQAGVARELGISPSAMSMKIRGNRPWFAGEIDALATRYGVTRDALFSKLPDLDSNQEPTSSHLAATVSLSEHRERRAGRAA